MFWKFEVERTDPSTNRDILGFLKADEQSFVKLGDLLECECFFNLSEALTGTNLVS